MLTNDHFLPSTTPGKHWKLYTYKPQGRPPVAVAQEGELGPNFWTVVMFQDRGFRMEIPGRLTDKAKGLALAGLTVRLIAEGWVSKDAQP